MGELFKIERWTKIIIGNRRKNDRLDERFLDRFFFSLNFVHTHLLP